jgi:hypothetical protein
MFTFGNCCIIHVSDDRFFNPNLKFTPAYLLLNFRISITNILNIYETVKCVFDTW